MIDVGPGMMLSGRPAPSADLHAFRRLCARMIDTSNMAIVIAACSGTVIGRSVWLKMLFLLMLAGSSWIFLETILLSTWGTTPGKWLLSTRLETYEGLRPTFWNALNRSFTVFTFGLGCFLPLLSFVCLAVSYQDLIDTRTTRWDRRRFRIQYSRLGFGRMVLTAIIGTVLVLLISLISMPAI